MKAGEDKYRCSMTKVRVTYGTNQRELHQCFVFLPDVAYKFKSIIYSIFVSRRRNLNVNKTESE